MAGATVQSDDLKLGTLGTADPAHSATGLLTPKVTDPSQIHSVIPQAIAAAGSGA